MLPMSTNKERLLAKAAEEDGCIVSVGGLFYRSAAHPAKLHATERVAFAKLIDLRRRSLGLTLADLAERARVPLVELVGMARGEMDVPAESAVRRLAQALSLPEARLLELAGYGQSADASLQEAAVRFAARLEPVQQLSTEEHEAMQEFVHCLAK